MADPRDNYQAALVEFTNADAAAKQTIALIGAVSSALHSDLASFMGWHCGVTLHKQMPQSGRFNSKAKVDMTQWPDATALKAVLVEWARSRDQLEAAWKAMTPAQQVGFSAPAKELKPF